MEKKKICPNCNKYSDISHLFCNNCGYKFETNNQQQLAQNQFKPIVYDNSKICPNCKNFVNPNDKKCKVCDYILSAELAQRKNYVLCPSCNNYEFTNQPRCRRCGYVFNRQNFAYSFSQAQLHDIQNSNTIGIIIAILGVLGSIISVFLPYITVDAFGYADSVNMFENSIDAYVIIFISVLAFIVVVSKCATYEIDTLVVGIINLFFSIYHLAAISDKKASLGELRYFTKTGIGVYLLLISSILIFIAGIILLVSKNNRKNIMDYY